MTRLAHHADHATASTARTHLPVTSTSKGTQHEQRNRTDAVTEIENGNISITEVWGGYAPDAAHSIELAVSVTVQPSSTDNIHHAPRTHETTVFLTPEELFDLARQVAEWREQAQESAEATA